MKGIVLRVSFAVILSGVLAIGTKDAGTVVANGNGDDQIEIYADAFLPFNRVDNVSPVTAPGDFTYYNQFSGDGNNRQIGDYKGSARLWTRVVVDLDSANPKNEAGKPHDTGLTHGFRFECVQTRPARDVADWLFGGRYRVIEVSDEAKAPTDEMSEEVSKEGKTVVVQIDGDANIPLVTGSPDIDYHYTVRLTREGDNVRYHITGRHDGFPGYSIWIAGQLVYGFDPRGKRYTGDKMLESEDYEQTIASLFSIPFVGGEWTVDERGVIPLQSPASQQTEQAAAPQGRSVSLGSNNCDTGSSQVRSSYDPNDMLSIPEGFGEEAYIAADQVINYTIRFENQKSATAEAIDVTVIAQLDPGIDLDTLNVGSNSHPDLITTEVDPSSGTITWLFKDINLPPNKKPPEGEGWVQFTASPRAGLPSGTRLSAKAAILFDFNPPIETNEVVYTIDAGPPSSRVITLEPVQLTSSFQVAWKGADDEGGSGIQNVGLLASRNGGPFELVDITPESELLFQGQPGQTYGFVTVAVDQVGNAELTREQPDVTVSVGQPIRFASGLRLLGVPMVPELGPQETLALPGPTWAAWDAATQTYLPAADSGDGWPVAEEGVPGYGLWARFADGTTAYVTGQPVSSDEPYAIDLREGWNLIANPYLAPVPWSLDSILVRAGGEEKTLGEAQAAGWMEDFAWGWDGAAYSLVYEAGVIPSVASRLEPWRGYWVQAHRGLSLIMPPP